MNCKKCGIEFEPTKGLISYCSLKCRNSRERSDESKKRTSLGMLKSKKVKDASAKRKNKPGHPCSDETKKKLSEKAKKYYENNPDAIIRLSEIGKNRVFSENTRKKLSVLAKERGIGGYQPNSIKKHKRGTYKGYHCDSSWELAFVIYNLENNIPFKRNTKYFPYTFNNELRNFMPDFILDDGTFVEIKGYFDALTKAKIEQFTEPIKVLKLADMKLYLDYVITKYGKDFVKLYS